MAGNIVSDPSLNATLSKLPYAEGAGWNLRSGCLEGTRRALLDDICNWARDTAPTAELYLLTAVAGAGKSAIAHTVAQRCAHSGILLTSFFFSRDVAGRDRPDRLFSTLAYELAQVDPEVGKYVASAIELDRSLPSAPLSRQFEDLVVVPSQKLQSNRPLVIVLDALDEGASSELLWILCNELNRLPGLFRVVVTSRPDERLTDLSTKHHVHCTEIDLEDANNLADIQEYIKYWASHLAKAKWSVLKNTWLTGQLLVDVIQKAEGLFQWVSVVFSYLETVRDPLKQLKIFISNSALSGASPERKMDLTYAEIFKKCNWDDSDFVHGYQLIIGAVVAAKIPMSKEALQRLHGDVISIQISVLLAPLSSLLPGIEDAKRPMRILHQSLNDFITVRTLNMPETVKFYLDKKEHSGRLALICLDLINKTLPLDIANLHYLSANTTTEPGIPDLASEITKCLSEEALYTCIYWVHHLEDARVLSSILTNTVKKFISETMVDWIETVAVLKWNISLSNIWSCINVSITELEFLIE